MSIRRAVLSSVPSAASSFSKSLPLHSRGGARGLATSTSRRANTFFPQGTRPPPEAFPSSPDYNPDWWRQQESFMRHRNSSRGSFKVGPYKRGKLFVGPKEDPQTFVVNCIIVGITVYTAFTLSPGESFKSRRTRIVRQRLYGEYGLTEADVDEIEGVDVPLSEEIALAAPAQPSGIQKGSDEHSREGGE